METREEENLYVSGIRQIIANIGPVLKLSWSTASAEEILLNLEATDENFHKYELVRYIKSRIEKEIGPLVDNVIDQQKLEMQDHHLFPILDNTVASSPEYNRMSQSILTSVRAASEKILQTIYDNQDYPLSSGTETLIRNSHTWMSNNDIESMLSSSFEGDMMFASVERYEKISSDLKPTNSREMRLDALNCLYQIPQSDIASSENWHVIKDRISLALGDEDDVISEKSLRFHAKMFASGTSHLSREIYSSLCQSLIATFKISSFTEIDLNDDATVRLINQLRLMNQFQNYLPVCWIRFPEKIIQELVSNTMDLLSIKASTSSNNQGRDEISPLHFLAVIDLKACWFKKWMHGKHSRASLVSRIAKEPAFIQLLCKTIVDFHANCQTFARKSYQKLSVKDHDEERGVYSPTYLKYMLFIHAVNIIEQLLLFKKGRQIFPVYISDKNIVDLKSIFVTLIEIIQLTNVSVSAMFMETRLVHPGLIITNLLKTIAKATSGAAPVCLCNDTVTTAISEPLKEFLSGTIAGNASTICDYEATLTIAADIFSVLASTKCGREHLLYGSQNKKWSVSSSSVAFLLADFTKKALLGNLTIQPTKGIVDAYLFICRQLYSTGEGFYILKKFQLNKCICSALEKVKKENRTKLHLAEEKKHSFAGESHELFQPAAHSKGGSYLFESSPPASTVAKYPTTSAAHEIINLFDNYHNTCFKGCMEPSHEISGRHDVNGLPFCEGLADFSSLKILFSSLLSGKEDCTFHEIALLDSLLSFAMTPKGVQLIQQSGYMNECIKYLYKRHRHEYQVSKIDKYGYGVLLAQLAATGPGILALESTGYVKDLLEDIWSFLEGGESDYHTTILPVYTEDMDERHCQKLFSSLINILSPFPGVPELISKYPVMAGTPDTNTEEPLTSANAPPTPGHLQDFLNQMVFLDSNRKIKLLYHFDFTHLFGLRVLSSIICCLDTALLLETRYRYQEILLKLQAEFQPEKDLFMLDACSLERNQILVRSYVVGGFSERFIPPRTLSKDPKCPYSWPLFSSFPAPKEYAVLQNNRTRGASGSEDFIRFICSRDKSDSLETWLSGLKSNFIDYFTGESTVGINRSSMKHILSNVCSAQLQMKNDVAFRVPDDSGIDAIIRSVQLTEVETSGIELILRYGVQLGLLQSLTDARDGLKFLYRRCRHYFRGQQRTFKSEMLSLHADYIGFDWFLGTIFLMFEGDTEEAWMFLHRFSSLASSGYLWTARLHLSNEISVSIAQSGIHPLYSSVCHNIQLLLQEEFPQVYSAILMSGYTSSQICQLWMRQCFLNYLDWEEICMYFTVCLIMGIDYQVYFCVCVLQHMAKDILCHSQQKDLVVFLKEEPIINFSAKKYIKRMMTLEEKYRKIVLDDLLQCLK